MRKVRQRAIGHAPRPGAAARPPSGVQAPDWAAVPPLTPADLAHLAAGVSHLGNVMRELAEYLAKDDAPRRVIAASARDYCSAIAWEALRLQVAADRLACTGAGDDPYAGADRAEKGG